MGRVSYPALRLETSPGTYTSSNLKTSRRGGCNGVVVAHWIARGLKHPRSALVRVHPQRVKLVNVSNEGADGMEHDEAVKMVNFSRSKKPAKCD